jgi:hypothetical protein
MVHMTATLSTHELNQLSLAGCREIFLSLDRPATLSGAYEADFVGPSWLRAIAGPGLFPLGLGGWMGKLFDGNGGGVNLVRRQGRVQQVMPVRLIGMPSPINGQPAIVVSYPHGSRWPWPYVIDELRQLDEQTLLGMTIVPRGRLSRVGLPFLLRHRPQGIS